MTENTDNLTAVGRDILLSGREALAVNPCRI